MYKQADLRLCWSQIPHCWESLVAAHISVNKLSTQKGLIDYTIRNSACLCMLVYVCVFWGMFVLVHICVCMCMLMHGFCMFVHFCAYICLYVCLCSEIEMYQNICDCKVNVLQNNPEILQDDFARKTRKSFNITLCPQLLSIRAILY